MTETTQGGPKKGFIKKPKTKTPKPQEDNGTHTVAPCGCVGETGYPPGSIEEDAIRLENYNRWNIDPQDYVPSGGGD